MGLLVLQDDPGVRLELSLQAPALERLLVEGGLGVLDREHEVEHARVLLLRCRSRELRQPQVAAPPTIAPPQTIARRSICARVASSWTGIGRASLLEWSSSHARRPTCGARDAPRPRRPYRMRRRVADYARIDGERTTRLQAVCVGRSGADVRAEAIRVGNARSPRGGRHVRRTARDARRRRAGPRRQGGRHVHRLPAVPDSLDGPPADGQVWQAQFAWQEPPVAFDGAELQLGAELIVELPEPGIEAASSRALACSRSGPRPAAADRRPGATGALRRASVGSQVELLAAQEEVARGPGRVAADPGGARPAREDLEAERKRRAGDGERFREGLAQRPRVRGAGADRRAGHRDPADAARVARRSARTASRTEAGSRTRAGEARRERSRWRSSRRDGKETERLRCASSRARAQRGRRGAQRRRAPPRPVDRDSRHVGGVTWRPVDPSV